MNLATEFPEAQKHFDHWKKAIPKNNHRLNDFGDFMTYHSKNISVDESIPLLERALICNAALRLANIWKKRKDQDPEDQLKEILVAFIRHLEESGTYTFHQIELM